VDMTPPSAPVVVNVTPSHEGGVQSVKIVSLFEETAGNGEVNGEPEQDIYYQSATARGKSVGLAPMRMS